MVLFLKDVTGETSYESLKRLYFREGFEGKCGTEKIVSPKMKKETHVGPILVTKSSPQVCEYGIPGIDASTLSTVTEHPILLWVTI